MEEEERRNLGEQMEIIINAQMKRKELIKLGRFLYKMFHGRLEHCSVLITKGYENSTVEETMRDLKRCFEK